MLAKINTFALNGIEGYKVDIEVDINSALPSYDVVGLPDTAIKESKERIHSAIKNSGLNYPVKKITVNMAPADTKKEGAVFDLAIAVGILAASEQLGDGFGYKDYIILGELSLDGSVRAVKGVLPLVISGVQQGYRKFILPCDNAKEASYIDDIEVYAAQSLKQTVRFLCGMEEILPTKHVRFEDKTGERRFNIDFSDVKGQTMAKRALEISVAGGHNALMIGPPGAGKTMLAKCVPTIMPSMTFNEAIEVTKIHSIAGVLNLEEGIVGVRPFRSPHHTATIPSLTGGGANAKPGEISLAHNGVLFLDEMPEYSRRTLETLRQPLEDGYVTISRTRQTVQYPAHFMLIASMNPCPCGNYGSSNPCKCSPAEIHRYINKLSGPLVDRIDLQVEVDSISYGELRGRETSDTSAVIKQRVEKARAIQIERFKGSGIYTNSQMSSAQINTFCVIDKESDRMLEAAFNKLALSARASTRILKVARTIADLAGRERIASEDIAEAIQYRSLDRKYWE